jgi:hypothetical protein
LDSAKNNIHNIYKMIIFNKVNKLIPKQLYSTSKHNVLALVFVLLVILVVQYPAIFSKSANTVFGKAVILLIIILLTNYNTLVGLAATIVALVFYVYLFDTGYEGFVEGMGGKKDDPDVKSSSAPKQEECSQADIMLAAKCATAPQCSNEVPSMKVQNPNVQPAESTGTAKSTSDATTLKPAPATASALTTSTTM